MELKRTLGFRVVLAIVIGGVIGSGIFMKPATMAGQLGSAEWLLAVWILAGLMTLCGALTNAEAAAMFPETGGQYVFFKKMYGDGFAFIYGWSAFAVFNTAGTASIAFVCVQYLNAYMPTLELAKETILAYTIHIPGLGQFSILENLEIKILTIGLLFLSAAINVWSTKYSGRLQLFLSLLKLIAILVLVMGALFHSNIQPIQLGTILHNEEIGMGAFILALTGAFWAYDGWNNINYVAGEVIQPQKTIPRALVIGIMVSMLVYILLNLSFLKLMGIQAMAESDYIGSDAASIIWGSSGALFVSLLIILSVAGAVHSNVLSCSRATYAFTGDFSLLKSIYKVNETTGTPARAIWLNQLISVLLVLTGSFDRLTDMLIFVSWFFYGMSALGVILLRIKQPDLPRPYKAPGYPWTAVIFVLFSTTYLLLSLFSDIQMYMEGKTVFINSIFGILISLIGWPLYVWSRKKKDYSAGS
ncbi:MAG: amino acid permease [Saprospiraceae bacterium]|nr:amino acid permease [Saprospiraceae bacterium]MBK7812576.1 amino acid permease [Saprospiraceae bacterium]MBK9630767.1 amino acid permease [Saprospiraceae bacterium]